MNNMKHDIPILVQQTCKDVGIDSKTALWNCHGTWVMYHKALEKVASFQNIKFDNPVIIEHDAEKRICVMLVKGYWKEKEEWTIGEAMPINIDRGNNKQQYPFAMAEKRAKDRVILKLLGLHGHVYSQEEFANPEEDLKKNNKPPQSNPSQTPREYWENWVDGELRTLPQKTRQQLFGWFEGNKPKLAEMKKLGFNDLLDKVKSNWDEIYANKEN
ncbi:MAG: hypothetical protein CMB16_00505 [Euryarchaeota archaeon]|nr:hypothetical protein [Euryarchaeota archaeon]|tara:strand:- start:4118 stop:4762 length:645 start_codon:yes stop_codon:yes gene_type:complete